MSGPRLELRAITRSFRGGAGVHEIDLRVEPGQIHAIVGLNGAGKTTLMRIAFGMLRPGSGTVTLDGHDGTIRLREALVRRAAEGAGILVSSHHLDEVSRIADVITVINRGRVIGTLPVGGAELERAFFDAIHAADVATGMAA